MAEGKKFNKNFDDLSGITIEFDEVEFVINQTAVDEIKAGKEKISLLRLYDHEIRYISRKKLLEDLKKGLDTDKIELKD